MASGDTSTATPVASDSDDESVDETARDVDSHSSPVHNELLFFLQNKSKILAFDDLVTICSGFYSLAEVNVAKNRLCWLGLSPASALENRRALKVRK